MTLRSMMKRPTAFLPPIMSMLALVTVLVVVARFGVVRQPDENAAAHIWQLLMMAQVPVVAVFAFKWLPRAPRQALLVLGVQIVCAAAALSPVYLLKL